MDSKRLKILMLAKDILVVLMFVVSIWLMVTSVKNESEAYQILGEADELFERTRKVDSLINIRIELEDSLFVQPYVDETYDDKDELP